MRILGIDPGTARVGYGVIEDLDGEVVMVGCGVIKTAPSDGTTAERLQIIYEALNELIGEYEPDTAAVGMGLLDEDGRG